MDIAGRKIGSTYKPYVIAEMSGNHNQSLDRALEIVESAAEAGAEAIKLQTYTADTMTLARDNGEFRITDPKSLWVGQSMHALYQQACTPWDWHGPIIERARERGIACFSSPFDESAVEFLETLDVPAYKIASFECIDLPLIRRVAETGKPMIISTGMATLGEIDDAVQTALGRETTELALLKCTSTYPASPENTNLRTITHMRGLYDCEIGLSDHTMGIGVPLAAIACGATIIEKHFTLARSDGGVDSAFSLEPAELEALCIEGERAWRALGNVQYGPTKAEMVARTRRRSLYVVSDMRAGDILTPENLRRVRPGHGLLPKFYDELLGCRVNQNVQAGTPLDWDLIG